MRTFKCKLSNANFLSIVISSVILNIGLVFYSLLIFAPQEGQDVAFESRIEPQ